MVEFVVKQEGERRRLVVNCKGLPYGPDVAQFPECMRMVVDILKTTEANEVVLSEFYERIYSEDQTRMLKSIADAITRFETEVVWSPSHLGTTTETKIIAARHDAVIGVMSALYADPFAAYLNLMKMLKAEEERSRALTSAAAEDSRVYKSTLNFMREVLENTAMIRRVKEYLAQLGVIPTGRGMYVTLFETAIKPSFIGSRIFFGSTEKLELIDQYNVLGTPVYIYKHPDQVQPMYYINPPEYTLPPEKYFLLEKTKEVVAGRRPEAVGFMDMAQARKYFHKVYVGIISDLAAKNKIPLTIEEKEDLATIVTRYTIGYGILEIILSDRLITDTYLDSPLGVKPIYIVHSKYGQCQTNVIFTEEEARAVVSRFRALSGRPFDEAHPILDFDLTDLMTRVCVIGKPLATDGIAFAFRLHKTTPWTLPQFLDVKMLNPLCAGMLSMFVDAQASMLIVGSRGSGKTSFLQALMLEIPQNLRIIVQEDTLELPVPYIKNVGYNIQRLKTRPPLGGGTEAEPAAEDALRTALRLGDSVLVVGEVRSSIPGWEEVLIVEGGVTKRVPIASLESKNITNIRVPTLGFDLKIHLAPLAGFVKHPVREKLLEVTTRTGRKITVTHDHSLFTATRDFKIAEIECSKLKAGDQIVIPAALPVGFNDIEELNIAAMLPEFRFKGFEAVAREAIKKLGWKRATVEAGVASGDIYNYFRTAQNQQVNLPISAFNKLTAEAQIDYDASVLHVTRGTGNSIPAIIPVNEDLCRFLGYYVAKGCHRLKESEGGNVVFTNSDPILIEDIVYLSKRLFGIQPKLREVQGAGKSIQMRLGSAALATLVSRLGCGRICTEKRVPSVIYGLSKQKIAAFLRGLYSGDGSFTSSHKSGNSVRFFSTSQKLVEDVAYLLLAFGIVSTIRKRTVKKGSNLWIVEFKDCKMVETFLREIGFVQKKPAIFVKAWPHTKIDTIYFDKEALKKHLKYPRKYRHLIRFQRCSKNYLIKVVSDPKCEVSSQLKAFACGEFFLDKVKEIREIKLEEPVPVYDLSVEPSENFVAGFGGVLAHNTEAKALYEAMRVGAVGNVVMGTIHGESAYSIWDRVVNDLGVPTTSFKATDFCIVTAPIRFKGALKRERRVIEITEVKKHWEHDPHLEGGFLQWMQFDAMKDDLELFMDNIKESEWIERIKRVRGLTFEDIWAEVNARGTAKQHLVEQKRKYDIPRLLESDYTVRAHNKYMLMADQLRAQYGKLDHSMLLAEWKRWVDETLVRELVAAKRL